jgi:predicted amidohydrolase
MERTQIDMATTVKIGMGQILVEGGQIEGNLDRAVKMIENAGERGCDILVLPECLDVGWTYPSARELAEPIPGASSDILSSATRRAGIHVVAGLTEKCGDKIFNAAVLFGPDGEILAHHRKINILGIARDLYEIGDRLQVAETRFGRIGLVICADNFPDSLVHAHSLCRMGARMILSPSAWAVVANHDNTIDQYGAMWKTAYSSISGLYDVVVVGVSNVGWVTGGPWEGQKCIGNSLAFGPGGELIMECSHGENAHELRTFQVEIPPAAALGTDVSGMLRERGYTGP